MIAVPVRIPWGSLYRRYHRMRYTRCAWCGGRSTGRAPVFLSARHWPGWAPLYPTRHGEWKLLHQSCVAVAFSAHLCLCVDPLLSYTSQRCRVCQLWRMREPTDLDWQLALLPKGSRPNLDSVLTSSRLKLYTEWTTKHQED